MILCIIMIHFVRRMSFVLAHRKNNFGISKNLARYRAENNFTGPSK